MTVLAYTCTVQVYRTGFKLTIDPHTQGLVSSRVSTTEPPTGRAYNSHAHINRSLPNMTAALPKAPKIYPIHLLMTSNYRLPNDVDR